MEYTDIAIIANPKAGNKNPDEKRRLLQPAMEFLGIRQEHLYGLETGSAQEFRILARDLAGYVRKCLIIAGGDGTNGDIWNEVYTVPLGFIALGSGEALRHCLRVPRSPRRAAERIADALTNNRIHRLDLVSCSGGYYDDNGKSKPFNNRLAIFGSLGFDSHVLFKREDCLSEGYRGLDAYARATLRAWSDFRPFDAVVNVDREKADVERAFEIIGATSPYYGYGLKIRRPKTRMDDGMLHFLSVGDMNLAKMLLCLTEGFTIGNRVGNHKQGSKVEVATLEDVFLQTDGTLRSRGKEFEFEIKPGALRMFY